LRSDSSSRDTIQLSPGGRAHRAGAGDWIFPYDPSMSAQHATVRSEDADFVLLDDTAATRAIAARAPWCCSTAPIMVGDKVLRIELPT